MKKRFFLFIVSLLVVVFVSGCWLDEEQTQPSAASGVRKASVTVQTNVNGLTAEQQNVKDRLVEDNRPGAIKHLYVISAYSGQVLIYSTVRGKITSSGKRLTPVTVASSNGHAVGGIPIDIGDSRQWTGEVLQDDGTYGSSVEYVYWWDTRGIYHQHYVSGGQILHVSSQPLAVKSVVINMELSSP